MIRKKFFHLQLNHSVKKTLKTTFIWDVTSHSDSHKRDLELSLYNINPLETSGNYMYHLL
jgi:hypothetical protein